jgi:2-oxoglutarate ferredoxin oxidoreductase subunit alpha
VIEQNRDAQLKTLLVNEARVNAARLLPVLHYDGTPITARFIVEQITQHAGARTVVPFRKAAS